MSRIGLSELEEKLTDILSTYPSLAVAVSGGADSTLLAKVAVGIIPKGKLVLVHALLPFSPRRETEFIRKWASDNSLRLNVMELDLLKYDDVVRNDMRRCYHCKHRIMGTLLDNIQREGIDFVADGTVTDDYGDYRPGLEAAAELGIQHPLADAGFDKRMTRLLARKLHIPNWNLPASACLASRVPCNTPIDIETLKQIEAAEDYLFDAGFSGNRVRVPAPGVACIEVRKIYLPRLFRMRNYVDRKLRSMGFEKVTVDINGYRRGAMNDSEKQKDFLHRGKREKRR